MCFTCGAQRGSPCTALDQRATLTPARDRRRVAAHRERLQRVDAIDAAKERRRAYEVASIERRSRR